MMMTSGYQYPVLTPQIEDIMSKATKKFKEDDYVKSYYQTAVAIQARQNGLIDDNAPVVDTPVATTDSLQVPPTNLEQK
jgi:hypothetical protein